MDLSRTEAVTPRSSAFVGRLRGPYRPSGTWCIAILLMMLMVVQTAAAGELTGVVRLTGPVPEPEMLTIEAKTGDHSTEGCGTHTPSPKLLVDASGGVQHAVVWLEGAPAAAYNRRVGPAALDQQHCVFTPHVLMVSPGEQVAIRNSDPVRHNVRIFREAMMLMHEWQTAGAPELGWRFEEPGRYLVRCGVHPWMYAWVIVPAHNAYALTDATGVFQIPSVPPGRYTLRVWHETLGELEEPVRVGDTQPVVTMEFEHGRRR